MNIEKDVSKNSGPSRPITVDDKITSEAQRTATALKTAGPGDKTITQKPSMVQSSGISAPNPTPTSGQQYAGPKITVVKGGR